MKTRPAILVSIVALVTLIIFIFLRNNLHMKTSGSLRTLVFTNGPPDSSDPLKYDSFVNHVTFSSVNGCLVSQYRLGEHTPEIAQSWTVNGDHTHWVFKIREKMTFSDGSPITAQTVLISWLRMAKIMKSRKSSSGFFENLVGYEFLADTTANIEGISANADLLTIRLTKPMPKLLDTISFGLYAIVHPSHFDKSGRWQMGKENLITSGAYRIVAWDDQHLILSLRSDYPVELVHKKPMSEIEVFWKEDLHPKSSIDISMGTDLIGPPNNGFVLHSAPPSSILFMRVLSWRNQASIFSNKAARIKLRNLFYRNLEVVGLKPIRSFFPLIIKETKEFVDGLDAPIEISGTVVVPTYPSQSKLADSVVAAFIDIAKTEKIQVQRRTISFGSLMDEIIHHKIETTWDITRYTTGILASDPVADVRFMFKSKEGILLPDETGEILKELDKENVDIQKVNELLWDQALIWPVTHYSSGLWARPDLDFSEINLVLPPTSFQWIGWKN